MLESVRLWPQPRSVDCASRDGSGRRWTCRLVSDRPRSVAVDGARQRQLVHGRGNRAADAAPNGRRRRLHRRFHDRIEPSGLLRSGAVAGRDQAPLPRPRVAGARLPGDRCTGTAKRRSGRAAPGGVGLQRSARIGTWARVRSAASRSDPQGRRGGSSNLLQRRGPWHRKGGPGAVRVHALASHARTWVAPPNRNTRAAAWRALPSRPIALLVGRSPVSSEWFGGAPRARERPRSGIGTRASVTRARIRVTSKRPSATRARRCATGSRRTTRRRPRRTGAPRGPTARPRPATVEPPLRTEREPRTIATRLVATASSAGSGRSAPSRALPRFGPRLGFPRRCPFGGLPPRQLRRLEATARARLGGGASGCRAGGGDPLLRVIAARARRLRDHRRPGRPRNRLGHQARGGRRDAGGPRPQLWQTGPAATSSEGHRTRACRVRAPFRRDLAWSRRRRAPGVTIELIREARRGCRAASARARASQRPAGGGLLRRC